jgi:hypothetical protein
VCEELFLPSQLVKKSLNFKDEISWNWMVNLCECDELE